MLFPDDNGETILLIDSVVRDKYGALIRYEGTEVEHCVIVPAGSATQEGIGFDHADTTKLQVLAPPGTVVAEGQRILIRDELFVVEYPSFDYSRGRRPVVRRHRPKVVFTVARGDVHDHL